MKPLKWILQTNLIKQEIVDAIKQGLSLDRISFEEVKTIPFSDELPLFTNDALLNVFYGSTTLILNAYKDERFAKGVFFDEAKFTMDNYIKQWGSSMLNADCSIASFESFASHNHSETSEWFLRPNEDTKAFSGTVMTFKEIKELALKLSSSNNPLLAATTPIMVSSVKNIEKEWRHFIVDGRVISSSRYATHGILNVSTDDVPKDLIYFVEKCCRQYHLHDVFVMDTALCNGKYYIIECNCFNGTGFYNHDIVKIVRAVNAHLMRLRSEI